MFCSAVEPIVHGLEQDYGQQMKFEIANYQQGDSPKRIEQYGLDVHGMVITDQDGKKLWAESGHKQKRAGVEAAIRKLLGN